jgi:hypothetical protein
MRLNPFFFFFTTAQVVALLLLSAPRQLALLLALPAAFGAASLALHASLVVESPPWLRTGPRADADAARQARSRLGLAGGSSGGGSSGRDPAGALLAVSEDGDGDDEAAEGHFSDDGSSSSSSETASRKLGLCEVWGDSKLRLPCIVVTALLVGQQLSGINAVSMR